MRGVDVRVGEVGCQGMGMHGEFIYNSLCAVRDPGPD